MRDFIRIGSDKPTPEIGSTVSIWGRSYTVESIISRSHDMLRPGKDYVWMSLRPAS